MFRTQGIGVFLGLLCILSLQSIAGDWKDVAIPPAGEQPKGDSIWYRCHVRVPDRMVVPATKDLWRDSMMLGFSSVPGAFEVFLNGRSIITDDGVAEGKQERFKVPKDILEKTVFNTFVIRLDGEAARRGLTVAPVYFGYHHELRLDQVWQVSSTQPDPEEWKAVASQPASAFYVESQFRRASTVFDATVAPHPGKKVSPKEALALLQTDDDLVVDALLQEPEIAQPTHLSFDGRGRMWVAQYRQYPFPAGLKMISRDMYYRSKYDRIPPAPPNHDRGADIVSVHEDADGDGVYESHKRVIEGLNMANAVLHGRGGIWVMQTPYLLFYPDSDGDDVPDADPEVRLAGFGLEDTHSVANGLAWGPDGWIYGAQGSTTTSRVWRPGLDSGDASGVYNEGCMVWRYHPDSRDYEMFADGSGNTFGLAFDAEGRLFSGHNGGDTRGWHHIQEGVYLKQGKNPGKFGPAANPYAFGEMPMMKSAKPVPRFSHMSINGDGAAALPERLRGKFISIDPLHHHLIASDRHIHGSTFSTSDIGYPLRTEDETFRPVYLAHSPDGSVTIADFREEYIAHGQNYQGQIDPESGRIYRLRGRDETLVGDRNLRGKSTGELIELLAHENLWHRQTAVRLLGERRDKSAVGPLRALLQRADSHPALESLWALHQMRELDEETLLGALVHPAPMIRAWAIRLAGERRRLAPLVYGEIRRLVAEDRDAEVRSQILSTARRLSVAQALPLVEGIALRTEDMQDPFIPLMAWFVIESHCANASEEIVSLFCRPNFSGAPFVREHLLARVMRRFAVVETNEAFANCARLFEAAPDDLTKKKLLAGFEQAFEGRALPTLPDRMVAALAKVGRGSLAFRVRAGERDAITEAMDLLRDADSDKAERLALVRAFGVRSHEPALDILLSIALTDGAIDLRRSAMSALQVYDSKRVGDSIADAYGKLSTDLQPSALNLLASRPGWAVTMLQQQDIPDSDIGDDIVTRLRLHKDENLVALVGKRFPQSTDSGVSEDITDRVEEIRAMVKTRQGDPYGGEPIFSARCASCHMLFHKGGKIGPDLTSYQREDLTTLLPSLLAPSAEIREGYENYLIQTRDGRALGGFLVDQDVHTIVLRGFDGADVSIPRSEIKEMQSAGRSMMPDGLLDDLTDEQLRDFLAYLRIPQPISP